MKKHLYLDIDGVLSLSSEIKYHQTKWGYLQKFNKKAVDILNFVIEKTDTDIIISSDWKYHFSLKQLQEIFLEWAKIEKAPIGLTPKSGTKLTLQNLEKCRAEEILEHVFLTKPERWVAIDDLDLSNWIDNEHFIWLPKSNEGIKQSSKKEKIIRLLNE